MAVITKAKSLLTLSGEDNILHANETICISIRIFKYEECRAARMRVKSFTFGGPIFH